MSASTRWMSGLTSRSSAIGGSQVVIADLIAALAVKAQARARGVAVLLLARDHFQQPLVALEEGRALGAEVDEDLPVAGFFLLAGDHHRGFLGERVAGVAVRHEGDCLKGPERAVEFLRELRLGRVDEYPVLLLHRLRGEAA